MLEFVTIGGVTRDIFFKIDGTKKKRGKRALDGDNLILPYGEKLIAKETYYTYGGGAANAAVCLARLGAKVAPVCNIGREGTGSLVVSTLKKDKVNTSLIQRDLEHHTGLSIFILGDDNEHTGFLERGANSYLRVKKSFLKAPWIYLSSLTGEAANYLPLIFEYAEKHGIKIAFNPGSKQLKEGLEELRKYIEQSEIFIVNLEEAEELLRGQRQKPHNKRNLLRTISGLGAQITLVTDGEDGSHVVMGGQTYSQPAVSEEVVDTTGAGDSFGATFAFAVARGFDVQHALKMAAVNSASVVSKMGAQDGLMSYNQIKRSPWL